MKRGSLFVSLIYFFVKLFYIKNIISNCLMMMIGDHIEYNTPSIIKVPRDALACRFEFTTTWNNIEL